MMAEALRLKRMSVDAYRQEMINRAIARTPVGRMGQADDAARTAAFLASDESKFLTGLADPGGGRQLDDLRKSATEHIKDTETSIHGIFNSTPGVCPLQSGLTKVASGFSPYAYARYRK